MALLSWKERVRVNAIVEEPAEDVLDLSGSVNVFWKDVRELDPIIHDIVGDPVNKPVATLSPGFLR